VEILAKTRRAWPCKVAFLHIPLFSKSKTEKHELIFKQIIWINHRIQYANVPIKKKLKK